MEETDENPDLLWKLSQNMGIPVFAFELVRLACQRIGSDEVDGEIQAWHVSAGELCDSVIRVAHFNFGRHAYRILKMLGIRRSEDVGRIVQAMVEAELFEQSEEDSISDFNGLFRISDFFESPWHRAKRFLAAYLPWLLLLGVAIAMLIWQIAKQPQPDGMQFGGYHRPPHSTQP